MSDIIYFDHAATTPTRSEVLEDMLPWFGEKFGSASTLYSMGREAQQAVSEARESVAKLINANTDEIYFTSGGTESDNWATIGAALANESKGNHLITSKIEHHAILESMHFLEKRGFEVTYLPVDADGLVDPEDVLRAITDKTTLITIMHANNEIGTIQPVEEIGAICRERRIHFHTDTVQTVGHIPVDVNSIGCNSLAISAHKLYGPKGIGVMYLRKGSRIQKFMQGGGQEANRRAGTHNVPGIVGLGIAARLAIEEMESEVHRLTAMRDAIIDGITIRIPKVRLNGHRTKRLPNNVNMSFAGIEGESTILLLDMQGFCVSSGSACTSGSLDPSHVLLSLGMKHEDAHGSLRMTLGRSNTMEHVEKLLDTLPPIVERLRMMSPIYEQSGTSLTV
jgi:cysteine desulfurase